MTDNTHIDIGATTLGYRRTGSGPDLLFVHGWPLHKETWRNVVSHLPDYTCHLIDLPGSGTSNSPPGQTLTLRGHVDALRFAIDELGLNDVVLVGHDSGGMIARFVAAMIPDRINAMILTGTEIPNHHPAQIEQLQKAARLPGAVRLTKLLMNSPRLSRSNRSLGSCFWNRDLIEGDFRTKVLDPTFRDDAAVERQLEMLASYTTDLVDELEGAHAKITCPVLLVWGESDPYFPVEQARSMCDQFAGRTQFEVVSKARLLVHEEHPQTFAKLSADFLAQTLASR